ncbi:DUF1580 domain-containing protein [Botrimarina hoheduenensis]|uniref:DUF1580 domain-containing protein n=1 Tax=Botrimarina hoheduenensis TaxID=2528000 RepID=A0A5C5VPN4_9BACT|nr:hypothetical protein Pla111_34360 [Botrimarina hoheduenensis]
MQVAIENVAELLSVATAVERETGVRPHPTTCSRWIHKGVGGIRLKAMHLGGRPMTTRAAVREFIIARTEAAGLCSAEGCV